MLAFEALNTIFWTTSSRLSTAAMSNNRFIVQTMVRLNQLRRLNEYGRPLDRERARRVCIAHIDIIDALLAGDIALAARRLEADIGNSIIEKTTGTEPKESIDGI